LTPSAIRFQALNPMARRLSASAESGGIITSAAVALNSGHPAFAAARTRAMDAGSPFAPLPPVQVVHHFNDRPGRMIATCTTMCKSEPASRRRQASGAAHHLNMPIVSASLPRKRPVSGGARDPLRGTFGDAEHSHHAETEQVHLDDEVGAILFIPLTTSRPGMAGSSGTTESSAPWRITMPPECWPRWRGRSCAIW
jgi:hypothetical protein